MSSLRLTFEDVYNRVSEFLGSGSAPSDSDVLTSVKELTYRGYRRFLFPIDPETKFPYYWSFLRKQATLKVEDGKWVYLLPDDFVNLVSGFKFITGEDKDNPELRSESQILGMRSESIAEGTPSYYAIRPSTYERTVGQKQEVIFWKTPDASYDYSYTYIFDPEKPIDTTDVFVGTARVSEIILQCALAAAELQEDEEVGPQEAKAAEMINALMIQDKAFPRMYDPNLYTGRT